MSIFSIRFDSRRIPYRRAAQRLKQSLQTIAEDAEHGDKDQRKGALYLLRNLSGEFSVRILLGSMMGDLIEEWSTWVHRSDFDNPDPISVQRARKTAMARLDAASLGLVNLSAEIIIKFS
jgi:hypothetical protein